VSLRYRVAIPEGNWHNEERNIKMIISEAITDTYMLATGKPTAPASGTRKYNQIVGLLDYFQRRWGRQKGVDWNSLYDPAFSLGTVTATDTFDIDTSSIRKLSGREGDSVRIVWDDGTSYTDYTIVAHDKLKDYSWGVDKDSPKGFYCARIGGQLVFNHEFTSDDSQYGGEIFVPCYVFPDSINSDNPDTDEVQVDDPDWLTTRAAAEFVRNDITRRARYPELKDDAQEIMDRMRDDNDGQLDTVDTGGWSPFSGMGNDSAWS
jgi:hypothetical protein